MSTGNNSPSSPELYCWGTKGMTSDQILEELAYRRRIGLWIFIPSFITPCLVLGSEELFNSGKLFLRGIPHFGSLLLLGAGVIAFMRIYRCPLCGLCPIGGAAVSIAARTPL